MEERASRYGASVGSAILSVLALATAFGLLFQAGALEAQKTVEVRFRSKQDGIVLGGTLTLPNGPGPHPGLVLVSGTGAQSRDMVVEGQEVFRILAKYFADRGVASLRYDERGVGASGGSLLNASDSQLAGDVQGAVAVLAREESVQKDGIGIFGHSGGALIAVEAATRSDVVDFLVLAAPPAMPPVESISEQAARFLAKRGKPSWIIDSVRARRTRFLRGIADAPDSSMAALRIREMLEKQGMNETQIEERVRKYASTRFRSLLNQDPQSIFRRVEVPVLALYGEQDQLTPPGLNAGPLRSALQASGSPDVTIKLVSGSDHFLRSVETDGPQGGSGNRAMSSTALAAIVEWVAERTP